MNLVFIFNEYSLHNGIVERYIASRPDDRVSLVKVRLVLKGKSRAETAGKILPQLSRRFLFGKLLEGLTVLTVTLIPKLFGRGAVFRRLRNIARIHKLPFHVTENILSEETLAFIQAQAPDLVVTLVHQIVKEPLLKIPRLGIINIHPGLLPEFKGIQPYFWELSEGSPESGATLHLIEDAGIDTGRVLARAVFPNSGIRSVHLNYYLTSRKAAEILPEVCADYASGKLIPAPQSPGGNYFRWPDPAAFTRLQGAGHSLFSFRDLTGILTGRYDTVIDQKVP